MAALPGSRAAATAEPPPWLLMLPLGITLALIPAAQTLPSVLAVAGAVVLLARPRWALYLLAFTVPYQSLYDAKLYGAGVTITEGVIVTLLAGWATRIVTGRSPRPRWTPVLTAVAVMTVVFSATTLVASDLTLSAKELLKWIELGAAYLAGTSLLETPLQRRTMVWCLLGAAISEALLGLRQAALRIGPAHFMVGGVFMRSYGTFEQPNPYAGYLGLALPLAVAVWWLGLQPGRPRQILGAGVALIGLSLLLTMSRGAWVGQAIGLLLIGWTASQTARRALVSVALFGGILTATVWPFLPRALTERLASVVISAVDVGALRHATITPENWSVLERLSQWFAGWEMFLANPILGVGIGNYNAAYHTYRLEAWPVALGHAHNHYLTVAAEAGIFGLVAFILYTATVFASGARSYRAASDRLARAVAIGTLGSFAAFCMHNQFDVLFVHGVGVTVGLLLAVQYGAPGGMEGGSVWAEVRARPKTNTGRAAGVRSQPG